MNTNYNNPVRLRKVNELPKRQIGGSKWKNVVREFVNSGWEVAEVESSRKRSGNVRQALTGAINTLGLRGQYGAAVRNGKAYIYAIGTTKRQKRREVVIEAGAGLREGRVVEEKKAM